MSKNIETLLHVELADELEKLSGMEPGTEQHKIAVDGVTKLMDRAIEIEKLETDARNKAKTLENEERFKSMQLNEDRKDRLVKNIITVVSVIGGFAITIWGTKTSLKFEETGTITTAMGRGFIQKLLPKK
jgi:hypothetical protein